MSDFDYELQVDDFYNENNICDMFDNYTNQLDNSNVNNNLSIAPVKLPRQELDYINNRQAMKELCSLLGYKLFIKWLYISNFIDFEAYKKRVPNVGDTHQFHLNWHRIYERKEKENAK